MDQAQLDRIVETGMSIHGRVRRGELETLARWAALVPARGRIVEVGSLHGRSTVTMALATRGIVIAVDNFCDRRTPDNNPSLDKLHANLMQQKLDNVLIWDADSRRAAELWQGQIHMLFIDGGHKYEQVYADLFGFGPHVLGPILMHDHDASFPGVRQAVAEWLAAMPQWKLVEQAESIAVLKKEPG